MRDIFRNLKCCPFIERWNNQLLHERIELLQQEETLWTCYIGGSATPPVGFSLHLIQRCISRCILKKGAMNWIWIHWTVSLQRPTKTSPWKRMPESCLRDWCCFDSHMSYEKKPPTFHYTWLFNRDPYNGLRIQKNMIGFLINLHFAHNPWYHRIQVWHVFLYWSHKHQLNM